MKKKLYEKRKVLFGLLIFCLTAIIYFAKSYNPAAAASNGYVNVEYLNIRSGPGTNYARVTVNGEQAYLGMKQSVEILDKSGDWYHVKTTFKNTQIEGYVFASYVTAGGAVATPTPATISYNAYINYQGVNFRTGPGTNYSKVVVNGSAVSLPRNQQLEVLSTSGEWCYVKTIISGIETKGYVFASYVTRTNVPVATPSPVPTAAGSGSYNGYVTSDGVNFRTGPGTNYSKVLVGGKNVTFSARQQVEIISTSGEWYYVRTVFNGIETNGYVFSSYVVKTGTVVNTATPTPVSVVNPTQAPTAVYNGYMNTDYVNFRSGPGTNYAKITANGAILQLRVNQQLEILSTSGEWHYIRTQFNGVEYKGYVFANYVTRMTPVSQPTATPVPEQGTSIYDGMNAYLNSGGVNFRTGAGTNYARVRVNGADFAFPYNHKVEIKSSSGEWYYVRTVINGAEYYGYVFASYVTRLAVTPTPIPTATPVPEQTAAPTETPVEVPTAKLNAYVSVDSLYVRSGPGTNYSNVMLNGSKVLMKYGQKLEILSTSGQWYQIRVNYNGTEITGYSYAAYITRMQEQIITLTPTPIPVPTAKLNGYVRVGELNVRTGPGTNYAKATANGTNVLLRQNQKLEIISTSGEWYYVRVLVGDVDVYGYCYASYVSRMTEITVTVTPTPTPTSTPTPIPTSTPTPEPTATPTPEPTATPTPEPTATPTPEPTATPVPAEPTAEPAEPTAVPPEEPTAAPPEPTAVPADPTPLPTATATPVPLPADGYNAHVSVGELYVREGAATSYSRVKVNGVEVTLYLNEKVEIISTQDNWHKIRASYNGQEFYGYVYASFVLRDIDPTPAPVYSELDTPMEATTNSEVNIRLGADTAYAQVNIDGKAVCLPPSHSVTIIGVAGNWYKIKTVYDGVELTGYVFSNYVSPSGTIVTPTPIALPTRGPEPENPTPSPIPTAGAPITPIPTVTPRPTAAVEATATPEPTATNTPSPSPTPYLGDVSITNVLRYLTVKTAPGNGGTLVKDAEGNAILLTNETTVELVSRVTIGETEWIEIEFKYAGTEFSGYVDSRFVLTPEKEVDFETKLEQQGFPESYKVYLRALHEKYPNWEFQAFHTGLDWEASIKAESGVGVNLIPNSKSVEWKSLEKGCYNWKTDSFIVYDGSYWVTVSEAGLRYFMDPRNWLTEDYVFMFEVLTYQSEYQTLEGVEKILKNTLLSNSSFSYVDLEGNNASMTYGQAFIAAAEYSGVSPYHLASRAKQEVVTGTTTLSGSATGQFPGYEGYYNFFNIGAYHSTAPGGAIANGLKYAHYGSSNDTYNANALIPWTSPYRSIVGGGYILGYNYIVGRGQNTIYLQKFNMSANSTYSHQYMANVEAPWAEAKKVLTAYGEDAYTLPIVFSIPVFENMPESASPVPAKQYNPNNWLNTLNVTDSRGNALPLSPTFDLSANTEYAVILDASTETVVIGGTSVSKKAKIVGAGVYPLETGLNRLSLFVTAENGDVREYIINVVRESN